MPKNEPQPLLFGANFVSRRQCPARCYMAQSDSTSCNCVCEGQNHGIERVNNTPLEPQQQSILDTGTLRFMTKEQFYKEIARKQSREVDFGVWWRDGRNYPVYRVTWVATTGEVYAIDQHEDRIEILGIVLDEEAVEKALDGWAGVCGLMNSLQWVRDRVA